MVLPEWNGKVVGVMHRMGMTVQALALEIGVQRTYVSKLLNTPNHLSRTRSKVERGLRSFAEERGINFEELWCTERPTKGADFRAPDGISYQWRMLSGDPRGQSIYVVEANKPQAYE